MNDRSLLRLSFVVLFQLGGACSQAVDPFEYNTESRLNGKGDSDSDAWTETDTPVETQWTAPDVFSSRLPLVVVDTFGKQIRNEPKIEAQLDIFYNNEGTTDSALLSGPHFSGRAGIEIRGCSSRRFAKRQYGIEFWDASNRDLDASVLGMSADADWVLHAPYSDKSLMRNHLAYWISNLIGRWAPRTQYVEAFVNEEGAGYLEDRYSGVYLWIEKIKRHVDRVDIAKLKPHQNDRKSITGGYIFNHDHVREPDDCIVATLEDESAGCLRLIYPKFENASQQQKAWVRSYFDAFRAEFEGPAGDYEAFIDVMSFVDHFLLNELFRNSDGLRRSAFMYKDRGGKLVMGPYWDCNICMGNISYHNAWKTEGWLINENIARGEVLPYWWLYLVRDARFVSRLATRWEEWRSGNLTIEAIDRKISETVGVLEDAPKRNFQRWPVLGVLVEFNRPPFAETWEEEVARVRDWLHARVAWMDENIVDFKVEVE